MKIRKWTADERVILAEASKHMWDVLGTLLAEGEITPELHAAWCSNPIRD